ncbi:unnamed protein product [Linum tenue]|uniref:SANT domain-containing protein n=1 Tax=Linum tenue TaxID=586396 RepID=A0AAV0P8W6_9ROSI|nr:unnamed protein product [Linum tenue]
MEMDEVQMDHNGDINAIESADQQPLQALESSGISENDEPSRETELLPRIGEQFQVPIPPLISRSVYLQTDHTLPSEGNTLKFSLGLPLSLTWIKEEGETIKKELDEYLHALSTGSTRNDSVKAENNEVVRCGSKSYRLVPGSSCYDEWDDLEVGSFLLGLYVFGKNLVQVQKFVESKTMGQILSFYYGKFYRSSRYRRWSECGKQKGRKRMFGQRIFTGSRQQELLSRLVNRSSEECQHTLQKVTKSFGEGQMMLDEYVFALKAAVGLKVLVEAVGIGKGKQDLTSTAMDSLRSTNHAGSARPEIPVGKECSKLTPLEIVNFLTGGYRLSKARSNDIFWEAVWPRLLARGWRSEQPKDGSRNSLVFIVSGVKKFSRRKLVKGEHYFDSVTDVLNKIGSQPALLELDAGKEENGWSKGGNLEGDSLGGKEQHSYLKPRKSELASTNGLSFTIVDTSLANGQSKKITQLRRLPTQAMNICLPISDSEDSSSSSSSSDDDDNDDSSNGPTDESYSAGDSSVDLDFHGNGTVRHSLLVNGLNNKVAADDGGRTMQDRKGFVNKPQATRKRKLPSNVNTVVEPPAAKRQQVKAAAGGPVPCDARNTKCRTFDDVVGQGVEKQQQKAAVPCDTRKTYFGTFDDELVSGPRMIQDYPVSYRGHGFPSHLLSQQQEKLPFTSSSSSHVSSTSSSAAENSNDNPQSRTLIDLNVAPIPQEPEDSMVSERKITDVQPEDPGVPKPSNSTSDSRRHSTRNRPLTTKALEALACGFLSLTPKRDSHASKQASKRAKKARIDSSCTNFGPEIVDLKGGDEPGSCVTKSSSNDGDNEVQVRSNEPFFSRV